MHQWPVGQVVKTAASHAVNIGSNPVRVTSSLPHNTMLHIVQARYSTCVIARRFQIKPAALGFDLVRRTIFFLTVALQGAIILILFQAARLLTIKDG